MAFGLSSLPRRRERCIARLLPSLSHFGGAGSALRACTSSVPSLFASVVLSDLCLPFGSKLPQVDGRGSIAQPPLGSPTEATGPLVRQQSCLRAFRQLFLMIWSKVCWGLCPQTPEHPEASFWEARQAGQ